ncbi:signal peptide peptidase SppA [Niabella insulamsoli]|uniref:signal peptide peptidase SppA n=1 Tax=Niabella insulamsoli TaxID=3144874 RepID=UPI0031FD095A
MKSFFKFFLAAFLALVVFCVVALFFFVGVLGSKLSETAPVIAEKSVLEIDLSKRYEERPVKDLQAVVQSESLGQPPSLYDLIRLIEKAKSDDRIGGILLKADGNGNGFASSDEIRNALIGFKQSKKFIIAYADMMSQKAYGIANVSDKIYVSPKGFFEWVGFSVNYMFLKGALDKLEVKPQIFYAGKFKSATEPLRAEKMTAENKLQTTVWLNDIYNDFLVHTAEARKLDTAALHRLADEGAIQTPEDAMAHKLIDGLKYDDEIQEEIKHRLKIDSTKKINFVSIEKYKAAHKDLSGSGDDIALIYATGSIVDGDGDAQNIGSANYIDLLRKARLDKSIKAIVVRVNSGGGSALASENIWREMSLAKKEKPLIVSFGDVAASGGYYISVPADSIFASKSTITGSIGVFGVVPDLSSFFKNKLGITFDGVATGPLANAGNIDHPMTEREKALVQTHIEDTYQQFKQRVAQGRKKDTAYVETIAQGRVWTGLKAKDAGLIDAYGGLQQAIAAAAKKAKLTDYEVREYPKSENWLERMLGMDGAAISETKVQKELGDDYYQIYRQVLKIKEMTQGAQTRLPFDFTIQ